MAVCKIPPSASATSLVVVEGATLACDASMFRCKLALVICRSMSIAGKSIAQVEDHVASTNIMPFGKCFITSSDCTPVTPDSWETSYATRCSLSSSPLTKDATLACTVGGEISIENAGQDFVQIHHFAKSAPETGGWIVPDVEGIFAEDRMTEMVLELDDFEGASTRDLRKAMHEIADAEPGEIPYDALARAAEARGVPLAQMHEDYQKFLQIKAQVAIVGEANGQDGVPELDWVRSLHMGSEEQLLSGQVVGDAFGVDPVFGALLNPTGGLVGPGNAYVINGLVRGQPTRTHGIFHDAAGFLFNYSNSGPGYEYVSGGLGVGLITDIVMETSDPLSGQLSGIKFWQDWYEEQED